MKYHITLMNQAGIMVEHTLDLPVEPEITWHDFENLKEVRDLLLLNPTMWLQDVTPDGMPDWFSDEDWFVLQRNHLEQAERDGI
jgi:hypothetical protein